MFRKCVAFTKFLPKIHKKFVKTTFSLINQTGNCFHEIFLKCINAMFGFSSLCLPSTVRVSFEIYIWFEILHCSPPKSRIHRYLQLFISTWVAFESSMIVTTRLTYPNCEVQLIQFCSFSLLLYGVFRFVGVFCWFSFLIQNWEIWSAENFCLQTWNIQIMRVNAKMCPQVFFEIPITIVMTTKTYSVWELLFHSEFLPSYWDYRPIVSVTR